jgi:hypothetical protein
MEGFKNYAVEMHSDAMIFIPSFIKIGSSSIEMLIGEDTQTHREHDCCISLLLLFSKERK